MNIDRSAYKKSSFGPAFLFLDKKRREALALYYTFCRLMDDIADEPGLADRAKELSFWAQEINQVYAANPQTDLGRELVKLVQEFQLPKDRFLLLIEGMQADVQGRTYQTFEDLQWYLWRVAGIVGLATLDIIGIKGAKAEKLAQELGFAVQLTNIVRDVYEDAAMGRVYIPQEYLQDAQINTPDLLGLARPAQLPNVLERLAEKSIHFYKQAQTTLATLPRRKVTACRVMGFVYRKNLAKIEKTHFVFSKAIKLSKFEKLQQGIYALFKTDFAN